MGVTQRKIAETIRKAKQGDFCSIDSLLTAAMQESGDNLYGNDGERRPTSIKCTSFPQMMRALSYMSGLRSDETQSKPIARDFIDYTNFLSRRADKFSLGAVMNFDTWNRRSAVLRGRPLNDFPLEKVHEFFDGSTIRNPPKNSGANSKKSKSQRSRRRGGTNASTMLIMQNVPICRDFQRGQCRRGDSCRFRHARVTAQALPPATPKSTT